MEQSTDENNRKDDRGDNEDGNEEATTSNNDFNDPNRTLRFINKLKTLDFNSADDVRQAVKATITDKLLHNKDLKNCGSIQNFVDDINLENNSGLHIHQENSAEDKIHLEGLNRTEPFISRVNDSRLSRKRSGRPLKPRPSKKYKNISVKGYYWGKLSSLVFFKQYYRSNSSSDDDSIFSI